MSFIDETGLPTASAAECSDIAGQLMLIKVFKPSSAPNYQFVHPRDLPNIKSEYQVLCEAETNIDSISTKAGEMRTEVLDLDFMHAKPQRDIRSAEPEDSKRACIASQAMDAATDAFFDLMEKNIDRWTYDASSMMLRSLAMQQSDTMVKLRREAADIQVKSDMLNTEFRAFFIESLVNFNCEEPIRSEEPVLELVTSDHWKSQNIEPLLAREYDGKTRIAFSHLHRRLCYLLDRRIHPDQSVLGPKAIAWTLAQALNACGFSKKQRDILEPILVSDFNASLEKLYSSINHIWIKLDILPEAKLEVLKSDAA